MSIYIITRDHDDTVQCLVRDGCKSYPLHHCMHHSPDGFEFGYGGSGPADLALSILNDAYSNSSQAIHILSGSVSRQAWDWHQDFKWDFLATKQLDKDSVISITSETINKWLKEKLRTK